jgi:hypothetical protein
MLTTKTVTKNILETIVHETFSKFGAVSSSSLLDSLKLLGFSYATNAGISINIEDLKTPDVKRNFIQTANDEIDFISEQWQQGFVSDTERFQSIIDSWNVATESLKNRIVDYYQTFDPANNLYIMAFSGARGNMSQVRQLVGLRGLMSDQEGRIIDLPIQANFREGLSSIDYIISSYGARKGIVDTALKTADSGYLTRRLIYVAQDLIIRENDCNTKQGVIILLNKNTNVKNIIGRTLISVKNIESPYNSIYEGDNILDNETLFTLKNVAPISLNIRSALTCKSNGSICQKCYGWDLAHKKSIALGEAVGIIAAQSIGEPGTQLTMRTFHTGGIFTGETLKQVVAPFSGKLILPDVLKTVLYRTNHGTIVLKLMQETTVTLINWKGIKKEIFLDIGSYLYVKNSSFIRKNELISEYSTQSIIPGQRKLKPISTTMAGEIRFENLFVRKMMRDQRKIKVNQDDGILWIASGKIFPIPKEAKYLFPKELKKNKPFANLKLVSPISGIVELQNNCISINKKIFLNLSALSKQFPNCKIQFSLLTKNYQYIDASTILGYLEIHSKFQGEIYAIKEKISQKIRTLFLITDSDVWKINSDQLNNFDNFNQTKGVVRSGNMLNTNSTFSRSGFFVKKDGFKTIFQNATPIFLSRGTILNYKQGDFIFENKVLASLVNYTQQTEDIVQGLPKIEELIEARRPKIKCFLANKPGVVLRTYANENANQSIINKIITCEYSVNVEKGLEPKKPLKREKQFLDVIHSILEKENLIVWDNKIFKHLNVANIFSAVEGKDKQIFTSEYLSKLTEKSNVLAKMVPVNKVIEEKTLYKYKNGQLTAWKNLDALNEQKSILKTKPKKFFDKEYFAFPIENGKYIFLEYLNPINRYELPISSNPLVQPGNFVDLGEPLTEGIIDVHDLLQIFFNYHAELDGLKEGVTKALTKFQLLLVNSIQSIYQSQGVNISSKHIEIIVRQMTSKVLIKESGDTPLIPGELIRLSLISEIHEALKLNNLTFQTKTPKYEPILMSTTNSSLNKEGFLSAAGFQETKRMLSKAAIEGTTDWLRGLKECIIIGRLIPAGSAFLNYKSYLDNIYLFKNKQTI